MKATDESLERSSDTREETQRLSELLDRVASAADERNRVSIGDIVQAVGDRSFTPLLLLAGLVMVAPVIGDIPGVPVVMGALVILISVQLILRRDHVWLPGWLERMAISGDKVRKVTGWLRRPMEFIDRWTRPRLQWAVRHAAVYVIAAVCIVIAAATPLMEVVPFTANLAGIAITAFALGLFSRDGLVALGAAAFSGAAIVLVVTRFV